MATLASSSEEVVIVRMGNIFFFPCPEPPGPIHKLRLESPATVVPCEGEPYFAVITHLGPFQPLNEQPEAERIRREEFTAQQTQKLISDFWDYLVGTGQVIGDLPKIVESGPGFTPGSVT